MRKINSILAVIALCVIAVVSCKKDETAPLPAYLGTWRETNFVASGCTDPGDNEVHACSVADCEAIAFSETQMTITKAGVAPLVYPFTASGTTLTVNVGGSTGVVVVNVVVSGLTLTLTLQHTVPDGGCLNVTTYTKIG
jgi:hypothetical protein